MEEGGGREGEGEERKREEIEKNRGHFLKNFRLVI
jgi:hypothetical protein